MVRSLWSAATGMIAQQTNMDTIANNLANVNTTGYKAEVAEFKSLLYQTLQTKTTTANGETKPVGSQVGLGVRNSSINSIFKQGSMLDAQSDTAFAIQGNGFFAVQGVDGETNYTRNGNFTLTTASNGGLMLATSDGLPVLNSKGKAITFAKTLDASQITISGNGEFSYPDSSGTLQSLGISLGVYQFSNPSGLNKLGSSLYKATEASGAALNESTAKNLETSTIMQGYLEASGVQVVDEMVNMITAQRAYELSSKAITTSDEMMKLANQLKQ